jgi:restriction system protein
MEVEHTGLNTYKMLRDANHDVLLKRVDSIFSLWDKQWEHYSKRNSALSSKISNEAEAEQRSNSATAAMKMVENILSHTLIIDDRINFSQLFEYSKFPESNPMAFMDAELAKQKNPEKPKVEELPPKPSELQYTPSLGFFDKVIKSFRDSKITLARLKYEEAIVKWEKACSEVQTRNENLLKSFEFECLKKQLDRETVIKNFQDRETNWKRRKNEFETKQKSHNEKVTRLKADYERGAADAVVEYCELVLNNSIYPDSFPKEFDLEYNPDTKLLVIDYVLPAPDDLPKVSEVKYINTKKEIKEYFISDTQQSKLYDSTIYQICLRTIHELFEADAVNAFDIVAFNGWVQAINKATGKKVNNCIASLQTRKKEFLEIELFHIDPKTCFKNLKGVASSKLIGIVPIQPLIQINRHDKRFVSSKDVSGILDEGYNLAAMGWEDFEHLLRELFEKEFSSNGGEVKVTQASRDGGVDAVAFDPDPIRGGKIVIQAKRYTNTVGVSAVRDLYGTVLNEGATKGLLVTTADYGPDAYEFARNKPITLLNGGNLLSLLEKHGHKARIDLVEAKRLNLG